MIPRPSVPRDTWPLAPSAPPPPPRDADRLPVISIVIPSFEQGEFLESAIRSVLLQGYPNLELMVVDGGSHDQSLDVIERYRTHLDWTVSRPDRGQAHAINQGFARATGAVIGWLNADDILLPGSLARIGRAFARRPHLDAVAGFRHEIDAHGTIGARFVRDRPTPQHLHRYCCLAQETVYLSRRVYQRIGGLDEARNFALDYEYWLRMVANGFRFTVLPAYLGGMRDHPGTKRATLDVERRRDLRILAARYGLGTNEEDAWLRGGTDHAVRLALLEDLSASPLSRQPQLALLMLRLLDTPYLSGTLVSLYQRYRLRRPRGLSASKHRAMAVLATLFDAVAQRPVGPVEDPNHPAAGPLLEPRLQSEDVARLGRPGEHTISDRLTLGAGWSWPEQTHGSVYRWAQSGAEILVFRPSGSRRTVLLSLESGPSIAWRTAPVAVHDESGRIVAQGKLCDPHTDVDQPWPLELPLARGPSARRFRLEIAGATGQAAGPDDSRVLDFRATGIAWAQ